MEKVDMIKYGPEFQPVAILMLTAFAHLAIMNVGYGIDDYVEVCVVDGAYRTKITKCKLYYTEDGAYFKKFGRKYAVGDFMRVEYAKA